MPLGKKASSYRGAYRAPLINSSVCVSVSVCVTFVVFTDCETCTRPISTNPGPMEAGEYGLTRGTCFLACRLEFDAVAGNAVDFVVCFGWGGFFFRVFFPIFFLQTHTACCRYEATSCLICIQGAIIESVCLCVCQYVCNIRRFY